MPVLLPPEDGKAHDENRDCPEHRPSPALYPAAQLGILIIQSLDSEFEPIVRGRFMADVATGDEPLAVCLLELSAFRLPSDGVGRLRVAGQVELI
jgi:hypothetical protein